MFIGAKNKLGLLFLVMTLAGCAMGWTRPNTTTSELYQDKMECEKQAVRMYPPAYVQNTYQSPATTSCQSYGNHAECTTTPGTRMVSTGQDANAAYRRKATNDCLRGKGYTYKIGN